MKTLRSSNQGSADLELFLICIGFFALSYFTFALYDSLASKQMAERMNVAATIYSSEHHLRPGDPLPPEKLVADGKVLWWTSQDGHVMKLSSSLVLFTKGNVPKKGEPYVTVESFSSVRPKGAIRGQ